nr:uncharacterized mitochondrial protein AtMg00810-like [Tanacetum cinerariifolium]
MLSRDSVDIPLVEKSKLEENLQRKPVKATLYHGMIGSLMYLTSSRPDLTYAVCLCARYQAKPTKKHLNAVKRVFRYLKGTINMVLWYSKDTAAFQALPPPDYVPGPEEPEKAPPSPVYIPYVSKPVYPEYIPPEDDLLSSDRKADRPEVTFPPRKRLSIVHCPGYEAGEGLVAAAARPIKGRRADYGFLNSVEAEIRRRRAE